MHEAEFFPGARREVLIEDVRALKNQAGEKRIKLSLKLPLNGGQLIGMPEWIGEMFNAVAKTDLGITRASSSIELSAMNLRFFALPDTTKISRNYHAQEINSFSVERDGEATDSPVFLYFTVYLAANVQAWIWAYENLKASVFGEFTAGQPELPQSEEAAKVRNGKAEQPTLPVFEDPEPGTRVQAVAKEHDAACEKGARTERADTRHEPVAAGAR